MAENMKQERISRGAQRQARYRDIVMMSPSQTRERRYARRLLESCRLSATHVDLYFFPVSVRQLARLQI